MRSLQQTGIALATILFIGCTEQIPLEDSRIYTTPRLKRIPELRAKGANQEEWESNLGEKMEVVQTSADLKRILSPWVLTQHELDYWTSKFNLAYKVIFYGTDIDGRMMIFYDANNSSIATWASWDAPRATALVEQAAPRNH